MSLFKSIATFGGFTLISRIMGFIRDMVIAKYLGAGMLSDAFLVSFKLPNLFRSLFAEGAFNSAFVPMLSHNIAENGKEKSQIFASKAISVLAFILTIFVILMICGMPYVVRILAPGFISDPSKIELTITLSYITFPFLLLVSIVSFQSGILNSLGRFAAPASTPIILNIVMIASVFILMNVTPTPAHSLAIGATTAGFIEIMWLAYNLRKENYHLRPRFDIFNMFKDEEIKTLFKRIAPGILGAGIYQINIMIGTILVSLVSTGAISWLYYADRLQQLPLGVVGAAIGVALLPVLSQELKSGKTEQAAITQNKAVEYGALLSFPAAVTLIVIGKTVINVLFQRGAFGSFETEMTYKVLVAYSIGLPFYVMIKALAPNFFARGDTKTPVKYSIVSLLANLTLSLILIIPLKHIGVALATSLAAIVSVSQYVWGLKRRNYWSFSKELSIQVFKIFICALLMGVILVIAEKLCYNAFGNWLEFGFFAKLSILGMIGVFGVVSFGFMAKITGVLCMSDILNMMSRRRKVNG
ncbi:MAG: murein biosynthesis integral membrane protein MurJ [Lactobacillaceae bacterium]|jgi:putative peptidoglycan lipid II flippase|nr:murein biosynthesis integral membrane protein MurJ [Lactobacillaceae bacterium]